MIEIKADPYRSRWIATRLRRWPITDDCDAFQRTDDPPRIGKVRSGRHIGCLRCQLRHERREALPLKTMIELLAHGRVASGLAERHTSGHRTEIEPRAADEERHPSP